MPNGSNLSRDEFAKLEAPLRQLDERLTQYASQHKMSLSKNYHNVPERSLQWDEENRNLIQIYLADADNQTYHLWLCASKDINGERYWKNDYLIKNQSLGVIESNLIGHLNNATYILRSWKKQDLVPSGAHVQMP